jgi:hypothetical protein
VHHDAALHLNDPHTFIKWRLKGRVAVATFDGSNTFIKWRLKGKVAVTPFGDRQRLCPGFNLVTCSPFMWS